MDATTFHLERFFCGMTFFENGATRKVPNPSTAEVKHALQQLQSEIDVVTRTVEIYRMPEQGSTSCQYCLQFRGGSAGVVVSLGRDPEVFAAPDFDLLFGQRGEIVVVGNYWPSRLVCTDFNVAIVIAHKFVVNGQLAFPEIWDIFETP